MERVAAVLKALDRTSARQWLAVVLLVAALQRLGLWFLYRPVAFSDTFSYRRLAGAILGGWEFYDGTRTPGYPLVMAIFRSDESLWLAQMVMGVTVTILFFYVGRQVTGRAWVGGVMGLAHTLNPGQLFFEPNLLSETAATFWLILTTAGFFFWFYRPERRSVWVAFLLGVSVSMAWLTRPLFIYLPFWLLLFLVRCELPVARAGNSGSSAGRQAPGFRFHIQPVTFARLAAYLLPVVLILAGWAGFIHSRFGDWSLTTMTGYHLIQHTGSFFEYAPDRYASLRDAYLKYRDLQVAEHGNQTNAIWGAIPEMQQASGASFYDLSRILTRISVQLIREHPDLYLKNVLKGWWYFWRVPVYWSQESFLWAGPGKLLDPLIVVERLVLFGINLLFLMTSIAGLVWTRARRALQIPASLGFVAGTVWFASILQTLVDHGDNPRFLVPLQSLVVLWVIWTGWKMLVSAGKVKEG